MSSENKQMMEWKPLKTAPKALGPFLVWGPGWDRPCLCFNFTGKWQHTSREAVAIPPTHWMPLPQPPLDTTA
jgi:hypothetical protein